MRSDNPLLERISKAVLALLAVACASMIFRSVDVLYDRPIEEDGYYVLNVAKNIGTGAGISADGKFPSNGFQPLWVFLCAPLFALVDGDRVTGLRLVMVFHNLLFFGTALLLGRIAADFAGKVPTLHPLPVRWITPVVAVGGAIYFMHAFNGLETFLAIFLYASAFYLYQRMDFDRLFDFVKLSVVLGFLVLARIDSVFLVIILSVCHFLVLGGTTRERTLRFLATSVPAFLVSLPWWSYNAFVFGNLMPSSGRAFFAPELSLARIGASLRAIAYDIVPVGYLGPLEGGLAIAARFVAIAAAAAFLYRHIGRQAVQRVSSSPEARFATCLAGAMLILILWYTLFSKAGFFYHRYFAPLAVLVLPFWGCVATVAVSKLPRAAAALLPALIGLPTVVFAVFAHHGGLFLPQYSMLRDLVPLIREHVPENAWVGAGQSGTLCYLRDRVRNLDGRVNHEALSRQHDMWAYLDEQDIEWVADWPSYIRRYLTEEPESKGWVKVAEKGKMVLYRRVR